MSGKGERSRRKQIDDKDLAKVMDRIAHNVHETRLSLKMSQQILATKAGIATTTLSDIELGKAYNIKLSTLVTIARQLKLRNVDELFN